VSRFGRGVPMPGRFAPLAQFNAEAARGIAHTREYIEAMAALQAEFDQWQRAAYPLRSPTEGR